MSQTMNEKMLIIKNLLEDYSDVLWDDPETRDHVLSLVERFYKTGKDVDESELNTLTALFQKKVNEFVKTKGN